MQRRSEAIDPILTDQEVPYEPCFESLPGAQIAGGGSDVAARSSGDATRRPSAAPNLVGRAPRTCLRLRGKSTQCGTHLDNHLGQSGSRRRRLG